MNKIRKGNLVGLSLKNQAKSRKTDSSIGYFDFGGKAIIPYNLKHYLRFCLSKASPSETEFPLVPRMGHSNGNKLPMGGSGAKFPIKDNNKLVELPWLTDIKTPGSILQIPTYSSGALSGSEVTSLASDKITGSKTLTSDGSSERMAFKIKNSQQNWFLNEEGTCLPHEIKNKCFQQSTWNWLSWSINNNSPITGRVARSLQRAGICVLIGGFTAFLPYKEYTIRNKIICAKEAELQSFQILSMKQSNLNCVLSKDRVTYRYDRDWIH